MAKNTKTGVELLKDLIAQLKLEGDQAKEFDDVVAALAASQVNSEEALQQFSEQISNLQADLSTEKSKVATMETDLATEKGKVAELTTQLADAKKTATDAEATAEEATKMLKEAAEQIDNQVTTKKGVAKTKVKENDREYMVNPIRKITGIPGHGDRVFTGKDVIANAVMVDDKGRKLQLRKYLVETGASIMEPCNGRG